MRSFTNGPQIAKEVKRKRKKKVAPRLGRLAVLPHAPRSVHWLSLARPAGPAGPADHQVSWAARLGPCQAACAEARR
jgi:hypothetical protein